MERILREWNDEWVGEIEDGPSGAIPVTSTMKVRAKVHLGRCSQPGCADGVLPDAQAVQGTDGTFYGTTFAGGTGGDGINSPCPGNCGTIFKITSTGTLTTLYNFCSQPNCIDGSQPVSPLARHRRELLWDNPTQRYEYCRHRLQNHSEWHAHDAVQFLLSTGLRRWVRRPNRAATSHRWQFYGSTQNGGAHEYGTIFKVAASGMFTVLYNFCAQPNCTDGTGPAGLVQATNGNFYGTTPGGGTSGNCFDGCGTVFGLSGT